LWLLLLIQILVVLTFTHSMLLSLQPFDYFGVIEIDILFRAALLILEIVVNHEAEQALCLGAWSSSSLVFRVLAKLDILLQLGLVLVLDAEQL